MTDDTGRNRLLHEAAIEGNVTTLLELLQQDPLLLDRVNLNETPLHVASLLGHVRFVVEILKRKPQLAKALDSHRYSPLHLAAAKGFVEIVKLLLQLHPDMCFVCNEDGLNPLHLAAARGQVDVLNELVEAKPTAARTAVDDGGGTVLHLCVKYNQLEALRMLIETVAADDSFVNAKDDYGFTVLHLAVSNKQIQTVQYLVNDTGIEVNALNSNGLTALDILAQSPRDLKDIHIAETLRANRAIRTTNNRTTPSPINTNINTNQRTRTRFQVLPTIFNNHQIQSRPENQIQHGYYNTFESETWISKKKDTIMVVASLIATMAFQAGVNPPGGVWQDNTSSGTPTQMAGMSIMAGRDPADYSRFISLNTTGFMASLSVILMLITGLPSRHPIFLWILIVAMWIAGSSIGLSYGISIRFLTPKDDSQPIISKISVYVITVICSLIGLLLLGKIIHLLSQLLGKFNSYLWRKRSLPHVI